MAKFFKKIRSNSLALFSSPLSDLDAIDSGYIKIANNLFQNLPSQELAKLVKNLSLTTNKKNVQVDKLVSKEYQLIYLKEVQAILYSFRENLKEIKKNKNILNYAYDPNELDDPFSTDRINKLERSLLKIPKEHQKLAKNSLKILLETYNFKYIRIEIKLEEKALSLLKQLNKELLVEIPNYKNIGQVEEQLIKLLISFDTKSKETLNKLEKHRNLLEFYTKKKEE